MSKLDICANESIKAEEFLLIDENGVSLGKLPRDQAIRMANDKNLDLIQVNTSPAVVKLLKLDKYIYQLTKTQKENRRKQSIIETKTLFLKLKIGFDAKEVLKRKARKFFEVGNKVIITMKLRKKEREKKYIEAGIEIIKKLQEDLSDVATVVKEIQIVGENIGISMILCQKKKT